MGTLRRCRSAVRGALLAALFCASGAAAEGFAQGVVFHDRDGDGVRGRFEWGLSGVAVSNGRDVVRSDWRGRYRLPVDGDAVIFVVKPRGHAPPTDTERLPRFYYVHRPEGSPDLGFGGIAPTGPLPDVIDFPLTRVSEPERFRALLFGDTQPYTLEEVDILARDVIEEIDTDGARFGLTLGDLVGDDLSLFAPLNAALAHLGIPWYSAIGNHDLDFRAQSDALANETFVRTYGPASYAFQVARVHFVVLDDVVYAGWDTAAERPGSYSGGLGEDSLAFVRAYLAGVPRDELVVLAMHIPLGGPIPGFEVAQRRELLEILSGHPHTFSLSAHTHVQYHHFFGAEDGYTGGPAHHHWNQGTAAGSWWLGALDEVGLPHATMRCGAPNGHSILHFDGHRVRVEFRAARRPRAYQMNISAPDAIRADDAGATEVIVNVFAGSERSRVELRIAPDGAWQALGRVSRPDPFYAAAVAREADRPGRRGYALPPPIDSPHLWAGSLPADLPVGTSRIEVRHVDLWGVEHHGLRLIRILPAVGSTRSAPKVSEVQ